MKLWVSLRPIGRLAYGVWLWIAIRRRDTKGGKNRVMVALHNVAISSGRQVRLA
jgi:hypothetical protein